MICVGLAWMTCSTPASMLLPPGRLSVTPVWKPPQAMTGAASRPRKPPPISSMCRIEDELQPNMAGRLHRRTWDIENRGRIRETEAHASEWLACTLGAKTCFGRPLQPVKRIFNVFLEPHTTQALEQPTPP